MSESPNSEASKSKNQEKNEAKRLAKLAKFQAKQAKQQEDSLKSIGTEKKEKVKVVLEEKIEEAFVNTTVKGKKKDTSGDFPTSFRPKAVEAAWYDWWEAKGYFQPELTQEGGIRPEGSFVIPIPPPNVTGSLHLGHALTDSIQDVMIRWFSA